MLLTPWCLWPRNKDSLKLPETYLNRMWEFQRPTRIRGYFSSLSTLYYLQTQAKSLILDLWISLSRVQNDKYERNRAKVQFWWLPGKPPGAWGLTCLASPKCLFFNETVSSVPSWLCWWDGLFSSSSSSFLSLVSCPPLRISSSPLLHPFHPAMFPLPPHLLLLHLLPLLLELTTTQVGLQLAIILSQLSSRVQGFQPYAPSPSSMNTNL